MAAGKYNFIIEQGATFLRTLTLKDSNDARIDITGASVRGKMRLNYNSTTSQVINLSITDASNGEITMSFNATQSAALDASEGIVLIYDIELEYSTGVVERILQGNITISREVTK